MKNKAPVFVKIEDYREVLDIIGLIREKLSQAKDTVNKISSLKSEEEREIDSWKKGISDIEDKLKLIDSELAEVNSL